MRHGSLPQMSEPLAQMGSRLATQARRALYGLRKQAAEPVFGIIKRVVGWRQMNMCIDPAQPACVARSN